MDLSEKVQQVKSSFTVECVPLIKSDRFTQEEYDAMLANRGTTHPSHFYHLAKGEHVWNDEEIADQIKILLNTNVVPNFEQVLATMFSALRFENLEAEKTKFIEVAEFLLGWNTLPEFNQSFWSKFGSAPYSHSYYKKGDKMYELRKKYGSRGMDEIFDGKFEDKNLHELPNFLYNFDANWQENNKIKTLSKEIFTSPYSGKDDLEDNVSVKKMPEEARKFYMDKTKPLKERELVFEYYGEHESYMHQPTNPVLKKIFEIHNAKYGDNIGRREDIDCIEMVKGHAEELTKYKVDLDYSANKYHPKVVRVKRNVARSAEAVERLKTIYLQKLMIEGVSWFKWDW